MQTRNILVVVLAVCMVGCGRGKRGSIKSQFHRFGQSIRSPLKNIHRHPSHWRVSGERS